MAKRGRKSQEGRKQGTPDHRPLTEWAGRYPAAFSAMAVQAADSADEVKGLLTMVGKRHGNHTLLKPGGDPEVWRRLYRRHHAIAEAVFPMSGVNNERDATPRELDRAVRADAKLAQTDPAAFKAQFSGDWEAMSEIERQIWRDEFKSMASLGVEAAKEAGRTEIEPELSEWFEANHHRPEVRFFFAVWMPCWVLYRVYPPELMQAARSGNINALDDLLRLDKWALADPRVRRHVMDAAHAPGQGRYARLCKAISGRPKGKVSMKRVKYGLAGLISAFASRFKLDVTAPDIRELFVAAAKARGEVTERTLTVGETLSKAVQRERPKWFKNPYTDKRR